jgi:acyl-CoA synthetase (AMP-forming)/AMP-acid ligase II
MSPTATCSTATSWPTMSLATAAGGLLGLAADRDGHVALADAGGERTVSYPELAQMVRSAAAGLARRGLRPGDIVGLYVADVLSFAIGALAIRAAGGVPTAVSSDATAGESAAQLADNDVRILLTSPSLAPEAVGLAERSRVRQVICFGNAAGAESAGADTESAGADTGSAASAEPDAGAGAAWGTMPFGGLLQSGTLRPVPQADADDLALLLYRRDHEGQPRPARITHRELADGQRLLAAEVPVSAGDVVIAAPPCGDGLRYAALIDLALARGATLVASPTAETGDLLAAARERRATAVIAPDHPGIPRHLALRVLSVPR